MSFPPRFLDELRARITLSDIVGRHVRLTRAGREFKACCPFHKEKTPSFYVNDGKDFFHCFGCGAHGDAISFVMRIANLAFAEAVERLAADVGLEVPQTSVEERQADLRRRTLYDLLETACRWFAEQLASPAGRDGRAYFTRRGLDDATIERFRLGYAPADGQALRRHLAEAGWSDEDQIEAGLMRRPDGGGQPYAFFRSRVMFPVTDKRGRTVAFGGRTLAADGVPKYVNSPDTPVFRKGEVLYNLSRARQAAADGIPILVVEGYMDVIALAQTGFPTAVAPLGTALTPTQIELLWKISGDDGRPPILCFDGDAAGRRAAMRAMERILPLLRPDRTVRAAFLPEGRDPDDLVRTEGADALRRVLRSAVPLADIVWQAAIAGRSLDQPEERAGLKADLEARVASIADPTVRNEYRREMSRRAWAFFSPRDRTASRSGPAAQARPGERPFDRRVLAFPKRRMTAEEAARLRWGSNPPRSVRIADQHADEAMLLATIINHPALFADLGEKLAELAIADQGLERLRADLVAVLSADADLDPLLLRRHLTALDHGPRVDDLLRSDTYRASAYAWPDAPLDDAKRGWLDAWTQGQERRRRRADLELAGRLPADAVTEDAVRRIRLLKAEIAAINVLDDDGFIEWRRPERAGDDRSPTAVGEDIGADGAATNDTHGPADATDA